MSPQFPASDNRPRAGRTKFGLDMSSYEPCIVIVMATLWVRRCSRCRTVDESQVWTDPAEAQAELAERGRGWLRPRKRRWECHACGFRDSTVEPRPNRF